MGELLFYMKIKGFANMRNVTVIDKNEFKCLFLSKANPGQQIKMRVMLFNLYSGE